MSDRVQENLAQAAPGGNFAQLLLLALQLAVQLIFSSKYWPDRKLDDDGKFLGYSLVVLQLPLLLLLHRLRPPSPPSLVSVEELRGREVVPLYRSDGALLLSRSPVREVGHLYGFLVVHVRRPGPGRLR